MRLRRPAEALRMRIGGSTTAAAVAALLTLALAGPAPTSEKPAAGNGATALGAWDGEEARVKASLLVDRSAGMLRLGVLFELAPGWHLYWRNPGESGLAPKLRWRVSGARVGPIAWPAPAIFHDVSEDLVTYGYEGSALLAADAFLEREVDGPLPVAVDADFLVCAEQCIPGELSLSTVAPEGAGSSGSAVRALFESWARRVPAAATAAGLEIEAHWSQSAIRPEDAFTVVLEVKTCANTARPCSLGAPASHSSTFVPYAVDGVSIRGGPARPHPEDARGLLLTVEGAAEAVDPGHDQQLGGVLTLVDVEGASRSFEVGLPLIRARADDEVALLDPPFAVGPGKGLPESSSSGPGALLRIAMLALVGGLLLNLMPCVLPVLAIKVFALADLGRHSRRVVLSHALAYTAGILIAMGALAIVVIVLRAAGTAVGWGFQLQEPAFVAVVASVLVVFALNLFGVFEIQFDASRLGQLGEHAAGPARSFFDGLLAVVLATPCSAPFLGTAVGFAFASPAPVILAIFLSIGAGLAAPFVLIALLPGGVRLVPRSGAWMLELRAVLGFALLLTVVWLVWVLGRSVGADAIGAVLGLLLLIALATWTFGRIQQRVPALPVPALALALAALSWAGLASIDLSPAASPQREAVAAAGPAPFSRDAVARTLHEGRTAFVYFTADWCITCKVNERRVLADARVARAFEEFEVAVFRADWTRRDETIRAALARLGKAGVPVYAVYSPAAPDRPELLPELLSVDRVLDALALAAAPTETARLATSIREPGEASQASGPRDPAHSPPLASNRSTAANQLPGVPHDRLSTY
jgi:thiol:disulfide interchange protein DsbD